MEELLKEMLEEQKSMLEVQRELLELQKVNQEKLDRIILEIMKTR